MSRRDRSGDSVGGAFFVLPYIRRSLLQSILPDHPKQPSPAKKLRVGIISDDQLAEIRGDREIRKLKHRQIAEKHGISVESSQQYCSYLTRMEVNPK